MLSPASLRVCCLAVMAPALTKADRRADCLPVVLSDPFCVSKTANSDNRKDKLNEIALTKLSAKCANLLSKRKPLYKTWFRTYMRDSTDLSDSKTTRFSAVDLRKALLSSKVRFNVESKNKAWHGTNVTLAVAAKVRLKYTMNKGNSSLKNMGLAKANTSLGLHSIKKMNRDSQVEDKDTIETTCLVKDSDLSDIPEPSESALEPSYSIVRIVQPSLEQSIEEVSSSSGNLITRSNSDHETFVSLSDTNVTVTVPTNAVSSIVLDNCSLPLSPDTKDVSRDSILPLPWADSECLPFSQKDDLSGSSVKAPYHSHPSPILPDNIVNSQVTEDKDPSHLLSLLCPIPELTSLNMTKQAPNALSPLPSIMCDDSVQEDVEFPLGAEASSLSVADALSPKDSDIETASVTGSFSSSTLSADASPLPTSQDEYPDSVFITLPDSFLASGPATEVLVPEPTYGDVYRMQRTLSSSDRTCCLVPDQEVSLLKDTLIEQENRISKALNETESLLRKYMIVHVQKQIKTVVEHLQKKCLVPCQRPSKHGAKSSRDMVDIKAELLKNQDVKNLSTAALVSLVRKLESSTLPGNLISHSTDPDLSLKDITSSTLTPEECNDVKLTSKVLLTGMKNLLKSADPDLTESSDDGSSDTESEYLHNTIRKRALWKFMKERAALSSRSTWLIARIHELENQLRTVTGILKKVSPSNICFEEQEPPASSTAGSGDVSLSSVKQNGPRSLGGPVNGYLDRRTPSKSQYESSFGCETLKLKAEPTCSRTRPLKTSAFQKRKLLVSTGLHLSDSNSKLAKLSTVSCVCNCQDEMMPCVLCTGRYNSLQSVDPESTTLLDRVALLDPTFHPLLSSENDIPLSMHFENILKKNESRYQTVRAVSPIQNHRRLHLESKPKHFSNARSRSRKLNRYARSLLSAKYRNKKHFRKHKLVFGKWRKLQSKSSFQARDRFRRLSIASSGSSHDSPIPSPGSAYDDGFGYDLKRRRDDNQFDIDDVIIPYSSKRGRLVKFEFKDIEIPSWRSKSFGNLETIDIEEDVSDTAFTKRHEGYEVEERKIIRNGGGALCFFNTWQKRSSRAYRSDSRADSSGANTPDPVLYDQDIMFQDQASNPASPAFSPPATPLSANLVSDDSQAAVGLRLERRRSGGTAKEPTRTNSCSMDVDEVAPYEPRVFPLTDKMVEELLAESDHTRDDTDATMSGPSCPPSPESTTTSTSTIGEDDITDPEWRVVRRDTGPEQALVLKFAKR